MKQFLKDIGPVTGEFHVYDRDREVRRRVPNIQLLERYLDETGGVAGLSGRYSGLQLRRGRG